MNITVDTVDTARKSAFSLPIYEQIVSFNLSLSVNIVIYLIQHLRHCLLIQTVRFILSFLIDTPWMIWYVMVC